MSSWRWNIEYKQDDSVENSYFLPKSDEDAIRNFYKYKRRVDELFRQKRAQRKLSEYEKEGREIINLPNGEILILEKKGKKIKSYESLTL